MLHKVKMPRVGENTSQVFVVEIFVSIGDIIEQGQKIFSVETEKAVVDIPSPMAGKVIEFLVSAESEISPGDFVLHLETE